MTEFVRASYEILTPIQPDLLQTIEQVGRVCYKSEDKITPTSAETFVRGIIKRSHLSVIEHWSVTVRFICDRGVSHELVRHRIASFSQASTRYVDYNKRGMQFIIPCWLTLKSMTGIEALSDIWNDPEGDGLTTEEAIWIEHMLQAEKRYRELRILGWPPEQARSVLPNSLKTELVMTANLREWRHIFSLRAAPPAHPQMRELMVPLLAEFKQRIPVIFDDILNGAGL